MPHFRFLPAAPPAARFCFSTCPRPRTGLSGPRLCPRAGRSVPGVSGAASGAVGGPSGSPSSGPSGGAARGPSGPPARRSHAPLPAPAAGGGFAGFFRRGRRFSRPVRHFPRPARRSPRPVHPVFPHISCWALQSRVQAFYPFYGVCTLRRRGDAQRVPGGPQRPFPCGH